MTVFLRLHSAAENVVVCWSKETGRMDCFGAVVSTQNAQLPTTILTAGQTIDFFLIEIAQKDSRYRWRDHHRRNVPLGASHVAECVHRGIGKPAPNHPTYVRYHYASGAFTHFSIQRAN